MLFFVLLMIAACNTTKDLGIKEKEAFILEIVETELIKPNSDLDFSINFTLTNNSDRDVWVPNPKNPSERDALESPEFFEVWIGAVENCSYSDYISIRNRKSIDDYTKIPVNGSASFTMNPKELFPGMFCDETSGNVDFQIVYIPRSFDLSGIEKSGLPEEILSNLLTDTLQSQIIQFDIK